MLTDNYYKGQANLNLRIKLRRHGRVKSILLSVKGSNPCIVSTGQLYVECQMDKSMYSVNCQTNAKCWCHDLHSVKLLWSVER